MYEILISNKFKRDVKRCKRQYKPVSKFKKINDLLLSGKRLPDKNKNHNLSGNWSGYKECHIESD